MSDETPSKDELLETDGTVEAPLTLDSLGRRIESLAENQNRIYEVLVKHTEERVLNLRNEQQAREGIYAQGFNMVNATLAAYTGQFDAILDELHAKVGTDKQEFIKGVQKRTAEIINQQSEMMRKQAIADGLIKEGQVPPPAQGPTGPSNLTEV